jgi:hypothetical protein
MLVYYVALAKSRCVHDEVFQSGCEFDVFIVYSLIDDMYANCGKMKGVGRMFNKRLFKMTTRTTIILAYDKCGHE